MQNPDHPSSAIPFSQVSQNMTQGMHNLHLIFSDLALIVLVISIVVCVILFACSLQKTMRYVPKEKRIFPNWFIWMRLIPFVGIVFDWIRHYYLCRCRCSMCDYILV